MDAPPPEPPQPRRLLEVLGAAAPALAAAAPAVVELFAQDGNTRHAQEMQIARERYQIEQARAELVRRERALQRREAELERERERLQAEAERLAQHTPAGNEGRFQRRRRPVPPRFTAAYGYDENDRLRLLLPECITYAWCVAFHGAPREVRAQASHARRSQYARIISRLPPLLGEKLDKAGVPFDALRFVAYAATFVEQEERARKMLAGERPPRRMPPPEEPMASKPNQRRRGRPAYPRVRPNETQQPQADDHKDSPTARTQGDAAAEQQATKLREFASLFAYHLLSKCDPDSEGEDERADDVVEDAEDPS
ncbi:hypothetical protein BE20_13515 [Sorangium cellulosum]|uniref:Uncharacterized protein n=1 Tax=Sorangium cellulosum TaxID=56 RepID=A0A150SHF5_SORCE|nr:hypothetical protein BE20_13515 [Sorangium cellulosum]KYF97620.1 hypothetical protein BE18_13695 [Sorangium cellulosum]